MLSHNQSQSINWPIGQPRRWCRLSCPSNKPLCLLDETWPRLDLELTFFLYTAFYGKWLHQANG